MDNYDEITSMDQCENDLQRAFLLGKVNAKANWLSKMTPDHIWTPEMCAEYNRGFQYERNKSQT